MTPEQVDKAMLLVSKYAALHAKRAKEMAKPVGLRQEAEAKLNERVQKAYYEVRNFLETVSTAHTTDRETVN